MKLVPVYFFRLRDRGGQKVAKVGIWFVAMKIARVGIPGAFVFVVEFLTDPQLTSLSSFVSFTVGYSPVTAVELKKVGSPFCHSVKNCVFFRLFKAGENGGVFG